MRTLIRCNFKLKMVDQKYLTDPARRLPNPHLINLVVDPKERNPADYPYLGHGSCGQNPA
jgi:hypothetical protein